MNDSTERSDSRTLVYAMAATMSGGQMSTGDLAGLRRMDPRRLDAPAFWKLAGLYLDSLLPGDAQMRHRLETAWGAVAIALAQLGSLQVRGRSTGQALAEAGYSEQRFVRLLRADEERLLDEIPQLARFLAAKSMQADLAGAALLLVGADAEGARRHLARDYYSSINQQK